MRGLLALVPPWLWALLVAAAAAWIYAGGWSAGADAVREQWRADRERQRLALDAANLRAHQADDELQRLKAKRAPRAAARAKEVGDALKTDERWAAEPVPAGVRDALQRAAADTAAGEPD